MFFFCWVSSIFVAVHSKILKIQPEDIDALWLRGMAFYKIGPRTTFWLREFPLTVKIAIHACRSKWDRYESFPRRAAVRSWQQEMQNRVQGKVWLPRCRIQQLIIWWWETLRWCCVGFETKRNWRKWRRQWKMVKSFCKRTNSRRLVCCLRASLHHCITASLHPIVNQAYDEFTTALETDPDNRLLLPTIKTKLCKCQVNVSAHV